MIKDKNHIKKVFITGSSGFIGSHVAEYFKKHDVEVYCLVRNTSDIDFLENLEVKLIFGSLEDTDLLMSAIREMDCVIHIAAKVGDWGSYDDFYNTNVKGTINLLKACKENNIAKTIITGSVSSYGEEDNVAIKSEESPYKSHYPYFLDKIFPCCMNHYRDTKAECTRQTIDFACLNNLNLIILEPVWVYGQREFSSGFFEYMNTVKSGIPVLIGSKKNKFHVIYARDLVRAYYMAFESDLKGVNKLIIGNYKAEFMDHIFSLFCKYMGVKKPLNIGKKIVYPFGFLLELLFTLFHSKRPPLLTRGRVNMFYDSIEYNTGKAEKVLGFKSSFSLEEGIRETVSWYKNKKLI